MGFYNILFVRTLVPITGGGKVPKNQEFREILFPEGEAGFF